MDLRIDRLPMSAAELEVEIAEHKGIGHPDTICDALAERLSVALSTHYRAHFGGIYHHNVDKALLRGGASHPAFGGGEVTAPIEIYVAGRATCAIGGAVVPVGELLEESATAWLRDTLHALDPARHVKLHSLVRPGSADLVDLYDRQRRTGEWMANDTSFGAGYAPLSELERAVLAAARALRRMAADPGSPEVGEDVKIMGVRRGGHLRLTVACALIGRYLAGVPEYVERRGRVAAGVMAAAREVTDKAVEVMVNAADDEAGGSVYLTVTGTSAEAGDDGQVGRGNRVNGLITPYRPMTLEAAAGKNPVAHVGKLYNVVAHRIAAEIVSALPEVAEAHCHMVSSIGRPVRDPAIVDVRVCPRGSRRPSDFTAPIGDIVRAALRGLDALADEILEGRVALF